METNHSSIVLLCPYFGTIEQGQFILWLKSAEYSTDIQFIVYTDDETVARLSFPQNVKLVLIDWIAFKNRIKSKFSFAISLESPYKLCDYRPAFGEIFKEDIYNYDFWGHMDVTDTIIGNLRSFLTEDILHTYDKIHVLGHLMLYRNNPENNSRYKLPSGKMDYVKVFSREENVCFDDLFQEASINQIYRDYHFPICERIDNLVADVMPYKWGFWLYTDQEKRNRIFEWNRGTLHEVIADGKSILRQEIGYIHFQKRRMLSEVPEGGEHFYIIPNRFVAADSPLDVGLIEKWAKERIYMAPLKSRIKRILNYSKHPTVFFRKIRQKFF